MPAALLIAAGVSAVGGIIKAHQQSSAAQKAADTQVAASKTAQNYVQQGMGQISQLYAPYVNNGANAANLMGRLTTPGAGARFASNGPMNATPQMPPAGVNPNQAIAPGQTPPLPQGYTGYGYGSNSPISQPMASPYGQPMYSGGTFAQMSPAHMQSGLRQPPPGY